MTKTVIDVDPAVIKFVQDSGEDYRLSTSCSGPIIIPISVKPPKPSDLKVQCGEHFLYISIVQARYLTKVTMDMIYDPEKGLSCSLYPEL